MYWYGFDGLVEDYVLIDLIKVMLLIFGLLMDGEMG